MLQLQSIYDLDTADVHAALKYNPLFAAGTVSRLLAVPCVKYLFDPSGSVETVFALILIPRLVPRAVLAT